MADVLCIDHLFNWDVRKYYLFGTTLSKGIGKFFRNGLAIESAIRKPAHVHHKVNNMIEIDKMKILNHMGEIDRNQCGNHGGIEGKSRTIGIIGAAHRRRDQFIDRRGQRHGGRSDTGHNDNQKSRRHMEKRRHMRIHFMTLVLEAIPDIPKELENRMSNRDGEHVVDHTVGIFKSRGNRLKGRPDHNTRGDKGNKIGRGQSIATNRDPAPGILLRQRGHGHGDKDRKVGKK